MRRGSWSTSYVTQGFDNRETLGSTWETTRSARDWARVTVEAGVCNVNLVLSLWPSVYPSIPYLFRASARDWTQVFHMQSMYCTAELHPWLLPRCLHEREIICLLEVMVSSRCYFLGGALCRTPEWPQHTLIFWALLTRHQIISQTCWSCFLRSAVRFCSLAVVDVGAGVSS